MGLREVSFVDAFRARRLILLVGVLAATFFLAACGDDDEGTAPTPTPSTADEGPHIRGEITTKTDGVGETLGVILIEGQVEPDTVYDKASVRIDGETEIVELVNGEEIERDWDYLAVGDTVEATFEGPVAESYPVQAYASRIVILERGTP